MKSKGKVQILIILLILIGLGIFAFRGYQYWLASVGSISEEIIPDKEAVPEEEKVVEKEETAPAEKAEEEEESEEILLPRVYLSSDRLEQGDTLLIGVKDKAGIDKISGEFGPEKIDFFKSATGDWIAIVGISVKKEPGKYNLNINFSNNKFGKELNIIKRDFPVTKLLVTEELEKKGYTPPKISENIAKKDNPSLYEVLQIFTPTAYFNQPFIYPLKKIKVVGKYGSIRKSGEVALQHLGVDLDAAMDTPVYAVNDGIVRFSEGLINYGKTLIIDHGLGIYSLYLHLNKFKVLDGEQVRQGDVIGLSGNTGYSIAPHLHFSIKANGSSVDPLRFIKTIEEEMGL
ncbi:M23 family metallopeptidase [Patescibacteria group bacterium]|nr:M23 family metallopeptidase [Patescibacteria group bacterium]